MIGFLRNTDASAAVEAAIFLPIFMLMVFGIADLGSAMFMRQQANAAAQAGAAYAVYHSVAGVCEGACRDKAYAAMNASTGKSTFCDGGVCVVSPGCDDGAPKCINVTVHYSATPILPSATYTWIAEAMDIRYRVTVRVE